MTNTDSFGAPLTSRSPRKDRARKKLMRLLARKDLEGLSTRPQPWHADKITLETEILGKWPHDEIAEIVGQILTAAR